MFIRKEAGTGCWIWTGSLCQGYGQGRIHGVAVRMHRFMWERLKGPVPKALFVLHNCPAGDNPSCCNPEHMFLGTQDDNRKDCVRKGRQARGSTGGHAVLTEPEVVQIVKRYANGDISQHALAREYDVDRGTIKQIVNGNTWTHLTDQIAPYIKQIGAKRLEGYRGETVPQGKLSKWDVLLARHWYRTGQFNQAELSRAMKVSTGAMCVMLQGKTWKHIRDEDYL